MPTTPSRRNLWIATEPLSGSGAQDLRDLGFRYLVMPAQLYTDTVAADLPDTDLFVEVALPDGGTLPLLLVDQLSEQLTPAAADEILASSTATEWAVPYRHRHARGAGRRHRPPPRAQPYPLDSRPARSRHPPAHRARSPARTTTPASFAKASTLIGSTDVQQDETEQPVKVELPAVAGPSLVDRASR